MSNINEAISNLKLAIATLENRVDMDSVNSAWNYASDAVSLMENYMDENDEE